MPNMKNMSALKLLLLLPLFQFLISCTTSPPDVVVFESLVPHMGTDPITGHVTIRSSPTCLSQIGEMECGHGVFIISKKEIYIGEDPAHWFNKKPWSQIKRESVYIPAIESYAPLANYIINSCAKLKCNDQIDRFKVDLQSLRRIQVLLSPADPE